jgi:hypothetical protein
MEFNIDTGEARPIKSPPYKVPYAQQDEVDEMINKMLGTGRISKSKSPWASPIVIVKKRDGTSRFCIDYRKLNEVTIKDNFPVPLIEETLNSLRGSKLFTSLDMASGYHQFSINKASREKTAFIAKSGLYEYNVLPFGLSNAVSSFQRTMEIILDGLPNVKVYLDDILIHSLDFDQHLIHLREVFERLKSANLKLKPGKCSFAKNETTYLGFLIDEAGIKPSPERTEALRNYQRPTTAKKVKRFLGMSSYYRKFIKNYGSLAEPINRLLKKSAKFEWNNECEEGFVRIIQAMTNPPLLIYPNFKQKFVLETDASGIGLGAVLAQKDAQGVNRAVGYASRMLKGPEKNYSATEIECLAIVWAVEHFKQYLWGREFTIECDHNPLVFINNMKNKSSRVSRWRMSMAEYQYKVIYMKGSANTRADALSRMECLVKRINKIEMVDKINLDKETIKAMQEEDSELLKLKDKRRFFLENGILFRSNFGHAQLVIPRKLKEVVLKLCHDDMSGGHLGFNKTWPKINEKFYWTNMYQDTKSWLSSCKKCAMKKDPSPARAHQQPINEAKQPFEMMGVDILGPLTETKSGNKYILVFTDYLSRWVEVFPMRRMDAKTIAKLFVDEIVCRHSAPSTLLSDQGAQFTSSLLKEVCNYLKTRKLNTTAYNPRCNGLTERFNRTLCQLLSMYSDERQNDWDEYIPTALFAYRVSKQETTKMSPFEILYGRQPRLPSDLEKLTIAETFVYKKKFEKAFEQIAKVNKNRKAKYDEKLPMRKFEIGDNVRLKMFATKVGLKEKLRGDMWAGPYRIFGKAPNGNIKLKIRGKLYITNPDRLKIAESEFINETPDNISVRTKKHVTFAADVKIN